MIGIANFFNFATAAICVAATSFGVALGESLISFGVLEAINIQPRARQDITKVSVIGMALTETSAILSVVISFLLILTQQNIVVANEFYYGLSKIGILLALALSGFVIGVVSSYPARYASISVARQPFFSNKILNLMLLNLSFIQTPIIFGFIIALLINYQAPNAQTLTDSLRLIGSGLSIGLGSIGPAIGIAKFAKSASLGLGVNRKSYNKILTFTFVSEAFIETPVVFALVTSLLLISMSASSDNLVRGITLLAAALCTGVSNTAPGISSGKTAAAACEQISYEPDNYPLVARASMLAQGLIDSISIYGWLVSLMLILAVR